MNIYTIHDKAVDSHQGLICLASQRDAVEQFGVVCNDPTTSFNKHPHDFTLIQIGTYNTATGEITPISPVKIATAFQLLNTQSKIIEVTKPKTKTSVKKGKTKK